MITLLPSTRSGLQPSSLERAASTRCDAGQARGSVAQGGTSLVALALEPSGEGPYVEAVREWIERVTPRSSARPTLFLVR